MKKRTSYIKRRRTPQKKVRKLKQAYTPPAWFMALPLGSHGNTPAQKRAWKAISQLVRRTDFEKYGGKCVSCPAILDSWQEGHCGHYKAWSVCHGFFKLEKSNLSLQCPRCNYLSDGPVGHAFGKELERRYGKGHLQWIDEENERHRGEKMETWQLVELVRKLRPDLVYGDD